MSRGADDILREYLMRNGVTTKDSAQTIAEEILDAMEAEEWLSVPKECCLMFAPTSHIELELKRRKEKAARG